MQLFGIAVPVRRTVSSIEARVPEKGEAHQTLTAAVTHFDLASGKDFLRGITWDDMEATRRAVETLTTALHSLGVDELTYVTIAGPHDRILMRGAGFVDTGFTDQMRIRVHQ
jgi:hypothetical protein